MNYKSKEWLFDNPKYIGITWERLASLFDEKPCGHVRREWKESNNEKWENYKQVLEALPEFQEALKKVEASQTTEISY